MTIEEAIKHISLNANKFWTTVEDLAALQKAIEAIEKQVPVAPYKVGIDEYECPIKTCRGKLTKGYPCKCGKIINWSADE